MILHVCQYVFQNHLKSCKIYIRRYNYTHDQLNTRPYIMIFLGIILRGGGRKIQVCPRAPDTLATPLVLIVTHFVNFKHNFHKEIETFFKNK